MTWTIVTTAIISFVAGAAIATWWHRLQPRLRRRIGEILAEICEDLD